MLLGSQEQEITGCHDKDVQVSVMQENRGQNQLPYPSRHLWSSQLVCNSYRVTLAALLLTQQIAFVI